MASRGDERCQSLLSQGDNGYKIKVINISMERCFH